jgi:hypothetical protein
MGTAMSRTNEARTRFVCELPQQASELFWAREDKRGDIQLVIKTAADYTPGAHYTRQTRIITQKYSLHPSKNATAATLHQTLTLEDGPPLETSAYQRDLSQLVWPLYIKACPNISLERYALQVRARDRLVIAASMPTQVFVLVYGVVVSHRAIDISSLVQWPTASATFQHFRITVASAYLALPPSVEGTLKHLSTNNVTVSGKFSPLDASGLVSFTSPSPSKAASMLHLSMESVRVAHTRKLRRPLSPEQWFRTRHEWLLPIDQLLPHAGQKRG